MTPHTYWVLTGEGWLSIEAAGVHEARTKAPTHTCLHSRAPSGPELIVGVCGRCHDAAGSGAAGVADEAGVWCGTSSWQRALRDSDLEPTSKSVGWALSTYADPQSGGTCYLSYPKLAAATGLGRAAVITHVHKLVDLGWLLKFKRVSNHGQQSNEYRLVRGWQRDTEASRCEDREGGEG